MPKISQLPILTNINTGSIIPIVDNSKTQKISVGKLYEFLSGTLDQTFSTEFELMQSASAITSSINTLSASFNQRINDVIIGEVSIPNGTISSSNQITALGFVTTGSNTFTQSQTISAGNSLLVNRIENTTGGNIEIAATGLLSLSGDGGGVTTNDNFEANPGGNATFKVISGSVIVTGSIRATGTTIISSSTQITNFGFATTSSVLNIDTSSLITTSSFNSLTESVNTTTASLNSFSASVNGKTGSYATTGSNIFIGNQTITGSLNVSGSIFLNQGDIFATASLGVLSQDYSYFGMANVDNYPEDVFDQDGSIFIASRNNYPITNGPGAQIQIKTGSHVSSWYYDANGSSYLPGDVNIGFDAPLSEYLTSGSLNIRNGNINLTGSLNVSGTLSIGGDVSTQGSETIGNFIEQGIFVNKKTEAFQYSSYNGGPQLSLDIEYQKPLTTGSGINTLAIGFPDLTVQTTAFVPTTFVTTSSFNSLTASLNDYTSSNDNKWDTLGGQTGSYVTSNQTSSFVTEAETSSFVTNVSMFLSKSAFDAYTSSLATTGSNIFSGSQTITGSLLVTGSAKLNNDNIVSSNTIQKIETISSASYAALNPPVSGTLYIII